MPTPIYARVVGTDTYLPKQGNPIPMGPDVFTCDMDDTDKALSWLQTVAMASESHEKLEVVQQDGTIVMSNDELFKPAWADGPKIHGRPYIDDDF